MCELVISKKVCSARWSCHGFAYQCDAGKGSYSSSFTSVFRPNTTLPAAQLRETYEVELTGREGGQGRVCKKD